MKGTAVACAVGFATLAASGAQAAEPVSLVLNWVPEGDHAPLFYALDQGWYEEAGIHLTIEAGKGSAMSVRRPHAGHQR